MQEEGRKRMKKRKKGTIWNKLKEYTVKTKGQGETEGRGFDL